MAKENWKPGNMLYPVPVVMVSCKSGRKKANIITIAWAGTIASDPPMVSISVRKERYSHDIIEKSGEFVINLVNEKLTKACDWCGVRSGRDFDKFAEMGLTEYVSDFIKTPAIAESPVNIYCKVTKKEELGSHDMYLAEVVGVTVSDEYMDDKGKFDLSSTGLIAYSHGEYFALGKKLGKFGYSVSKEKTARTVKPAQKKVKEASKKKVQEVLKKKVSERSKKKTSEASKRKATEAPKKKSVQSGRKTDRKVTKKAVKK